MNVTSSAHQVTFDEIDGAVAPGKVLADITDVAMDKQFVERSRYDWCWLSSRNVPPETGLVYGR